MILVKNKKLLVFFSILLSFIVILIGTYYVLRVKEQAEESGAAGNVSLYFEPVELSTNYNTVLNPKLKINPQGESVTAIELYLSFDKTKMVIESITNSTAFPTILRVANIDNNNGTASIILGVAVTTPITTISDVATIRVKSKTVSGDAILKVATTSKVAAIGKIDSVLGTFGQLLLKVHTSGGTGTPTATATPTPQPTKTPTSQPTSTGGGKIGDINSDSKVDIVDIGIIIDNYGSNNPTNPKVDINKDSKVDIVDIGIIIDNYGS